MHKCAKYMHWFSMHQHSPQVTCVEECYLFDSIMSYRYKNPLQAYNQFWVSFTVISTMKTPTMGKPASCNSHETLHIGNSLTPFILQDVRWHFTQQTLTYTWKNNSFTISASLVRSQVWNTVRGRNQTFLHVLNVPIAEYASQMLVNMLPTIHLLKFMKN